MQSIYIKMYERNGNLVCYILSVGTNVCSGRLSSVVVAGFERLQTDVSADLFRLIKLSVFKNSAVNDSSFEGVTVIEMQPFTGETDDAIKLILGYLHYQERKQSYLTFW